MLRIYACLAHEHDLRLVVVAGLLCFLSVCTAFAAFEQAQGKSARRPFWITLAALAAGIGTWATHFVAMLAYRADVPISYDFSITLLSVAAAVVMTGVGWTVALGRRPAAPALGGAIIGAGIGIMHYIGMAAVVVAGRMVWDIGLVFFSLALGTVLAAASLWVQSRAGRRSFWLPSMLLLLAICGLHFAGMSATIIYPDPRIPVSQAIQSSTLAAIVTGGALLVLAIGFGLVLFDRNLTRTQLGEARKREALAQEVLKGAAEREALTEELKRYAAISSAALDNMAQGLSMYDEQHRLIIHNRRYAEIYDLPDHLLEVGTPHAKVLEFVGGSEASAHAPPDAIKAASTPGPLSMEVRLGNGRIVHIQRRVLPDGSWVATHEDVTEKRLASERIAYLAAHDVLTGLPNRSTFAERLKTAAASLSRGGRFALHAIDLDRFKEVNDTLGHPVGDEILREVSKRLRQLVREGDLVTRLGGDEFAILQCAIEGPDDAATLAARITQTLSEPFQFDGHTLAIGASIGISLAPEDGTDTDELLKRSDLALYRTKAESRGSFRFFEQGMDSRLRERRQVEADLRIAVQDGGFEIDYQPLLDLASGRIDCFEALVRWRHPTRGLVQPADFIGIAEDTGLIIPIGEWVLRQACRDAASWPDEVRVAVNLSPAQFKRGDLLSMTMNALAAAGLSPQRLELEITESVLLHDETWVRSVLDKLTALGVRIAMDDFGTGYSSLSYLRSFPFTKIKIDRSFISDLVGTEDSLAIVQATIQLSQRLGLTTTAEGVETAEQLAILADEGCSQVQGFHVSRPVPAAMVAQILRNHGQAGGPAAEPISLADVRRKRGKVAANR